MTTLYIDHKDIEVRADGARLAIYQQNKRTGSVPLSQIDNVVTHGNTRLDTRVLASLAEHNIGFVALSQRKASRTVVIPGYHHNDIQRRINQYAVVGDVQQCARWARVLVLHKIKNQHRLINRLMAARKDKRYPLYKAKKSLKQQIVDLLHNKTIAVEILRGVEGAAAANYFKAFGCVFAPSLDFNGRNRRPPKDPVNACLSLGYTLMHAEAILACHYAGLDPMLGFYHRPAFGRASLASDLIEPFRPSVDEWVWGLFRRGKLTGEHFSENKGACLLGKTGRRVFYSEYECYAGIHRRGLKRTARILARKLTGENNG